MKKKSEQMFLTKKRILILILLLLIISVLIFFIVDLVIYIKTENKRKTSLLPNIIKKLNNYDEKLIENYNFKINKENIWIVSWYYNNNSYKNNVINSFVKYQPFENTYSFYIAFNLIDSKHKNNTTTNLFYLNTISINNLDLLNAETINNLYSNIGISLEKKE